MLDTEFCTNEILDWLCLNYSLKQLCVLRCCCYLHFVNEETEVQSLCLAELECEHLLAKCDHFNLHPLSQDCSQIIKYKKGKKGLHKKGKKGTLREEKGWDNKEASSSTYRKILGTFQWISRAFMSCVIIKASLSPWCENDRCILCSA